MQMERHIARGIGWVAYVVLGGILCGFPAKAGQNAQKPFVKVNLVELDSSALGGAVGYAGNLCRASIPNPEVRL